MIKTFFFSSDGFLAGPQIVVYMAVLSKKKKKKWKWKWECGEMKGEMKKKILSIISNLWNFVRSIQQLKERKCIIKMKCKNK